MPRVKPDDWPTEDPLVPSSIFVPGTQASEKGWNEILVGKVTTPLASSLAPINGQFTGFRYMLMITTNGHIQVAAEDVVDNAKVTIGVCWVTDENASCVPDTYQQTLFTPDGTQEIPIFWSMNVMQTSINIDTVATTYFVRVLARVEQFKLDDVLTDPIEDSWTVVGTPASFLNLALIQLK